MRLVSAVFAVYLLNAAILGAVITLRAGAATRAEIASSMQLAQALVIDTLRLLHESNRRAPLESLNFNLQHVRHVRVSVIDDAGRAAGAGPMVDAAPDLSIAAPSWFAALVAPKVERREFPVILEGKRYGTVEIRSDPSDEVTEAWSYAAALLATLSLLTVLTSVSVFFLFKRMLRPLAILVSGLKKIEGRRFEVRLRPTSLVEVAPIVDAFNNVAEALNRAEDANRALHRQLINAQDDERRRTALELHDEAGPCLFALEATATSIARLVAEGDHAGLTQRANEVVTLVARIQGINRRVLDRLRPIALGRVPLRESIERLVGGFTSTRGTPEIDVRLEALAPTYGRLVDLTLYRCVQEGLTNALRHADASKVSVLVKTSRLGAVEVLDVAIEDDGRGATHHAHQGYGLTGMRERVEALGGSFTIRDGVDGGTSLLIRIPHSPGPTPDDADRVAEVALS